MCRPIPYGFLESDKKGLIQNKTDELLALYTQILNPDLDDDDRLSLMVKYCSVYNSLIGSGDLRQRDYVLFR